MLKDRRKSDLKKESPKRKYSLIGGVPYGGFTVHH